MQTHPAFSANYSPPAGPGEGSALCHAEPSVNRLLLPAQGELTEIIVVAALSLFCLERALCSDLLHPRRWLLASPFMMVDRPSSPSPGRGLCGQQGGEEQGPSLPSTHLIIGTVGGLPCAPSGSHHRGAGTPSEVAMLSGGGDAGLSPVPCSQCGRETTRV